MQEFEGLENHPLNFERLFASHIAFTFEENVVRLIEANKLIKPSGKRYEATEVGMRNIYDAIQRTQVFRESPEFRELEEKLRERVEAARSGIIQATEIDNVNLRGRIIEYFVTYPEKEINPELLANVQNRTVLSDLFTADGLGDYQFNSGPFKVEVDIKSKMMYLNSNPKGYNIDKLLEFLAKDNTIYLLFIVGVDELHQVWSQLVSIFDEQVLSATQIRHHWAGRNSRGVTQYQGESFTTIIDRYQPYIDTQQATLFLKYLVDLN